MSSANDGRARRRRSVKTREVTERNDSPELRESLKKFANLLCGEYELDLWEAEPLTCENFKDTRTVSPAHPESCDGSSSDD